MKSCIIIGYVYLTNTTSRLELIATGLGLMSMIHSSNHWTVILGGNVELSITMTLVISILGFGNFIAKIS